MGQENEIKINPLPSKTWNWLKLNDVTIRWNMDVSPCRIQETGSQQTETLKENDCDLKIATGAGQETDAIFTVDNIAKKAIADKQKKSKVCVNISSEAEDSAGLLYIRAKEGEQISVIETFLPGESGQLAFRTLVQAEKDSKVRLVQVFMQDQTLLNDVGCVCDRQADFEVVQLFVGKGNLYNGIRTDLKGEFAHTSQSIGYFGQHKQVIDVNLVVNHFGKKTNSEIQVDGTLKDAASKTFRGTIDFKNGSSQSVGAETESVLLLGDEVVNKTIPVILCAEEDVEGSHGATIGDLDEETLFYFASRGIDKDAAQEIVARGKMEVLYRKIQDDEVEQLVEKQLLEVM